MPITIELLADHPVHGAKGKSLNLEDSVANTLVAAGVAKAATKPADDGKLNPTELAIAESVTGTLLKTIQVELDKRDEQQKTITGSITKAFGSLHNPAQVKDKELEGRFGFETDGHWLMAVKEACKPGGGKIDERLLKAPSGINTTTGPDGGYLVPQQINNAIWEGVYEQSGLLSRVDRHMVTAGNSLVLKAVDETSRATGSRKGGVRGYWLSEAEQYTASKPKFREFTLKPHKLGVFYFATEEQMSDTVGYNLPAKLAQYATDEITWLVDEAIIAGDGVGKPAGILNSGCLVTINKESSQTADTINYQNIIKMYARLFSRSRANAVWLVNQDCLPTLMSMTAPTASGTAVVWMSGGNYPNASGAPYPAILGLPVVATEHNPTVGDAGDIVLADLSYYALATIGNVNSAMSIHLRFDYAETAWRFDYRVDGQCYLKSPITPAKGSANQSPFIAIEARA